MTQKELLYLEDAVGHEQNIISIIEEELQKLEDDNLITFMQEQLDKHTSTKENLINLLEENINE